MYDFFVGKLKCQTCGRISPSNQTTNNQTKICINPAKDEYGVGDSLPIDTINLCGSGYICRIIPKNPTTFNLLSNWECPFCDYAYNWVVIEIKESIIISMKEAILDESTLNSLDLVTDDIVDFDWDLVGDKFKQH